REPRRLASISVQATIPLTSGVPGMQRGSLLLDRDRRNLHPGIVHQGGRLNGRARGLRIRKNGLVHLVHFRKIMNVGQVYRDRNNVLQFVSRRLQYLRNVVERRFGLRTNAPAGQLAALVRSFLTRNVERIAGDDPIAEGKASGSRQIDRLVFLSRAKRGRRGKGECQNWRKQAHGIESHSSLL